MKTHPNASCRDIRGILNGKLSCLNGKASWACAQYHYRGKSFTKRQDDVAQAEVHMTYSN
jgi:hypothetical protein